MASVKSRPQVPAQDRTCLAPDLIEQPPADGLPLRQEDSAASTWWLAHEFGNLLTGLLGFAELGLAATPAGSAAHQYLCEIHQSAQQGKEFLHQFLASGAKVHPHQDTPGNAGPPTTAAPPGRAP